MKGAKEPKSRHRQLVLTQIEKLDGHHPGLALKVKTWFEKGIECAAIPELLLETYGVTVTAREVETFRTRRWVPEKMAIQEKREALKAAIETFGGDAGLDAAALAKLWELMDRMSIPQLISARALFIKIRAQNLKEQEFLYKTGQLKPGQELDRETQQKNVLRRVKEIFGLADDDEPPAVVTIAVPPGGPAPAESGGDDAQAAGVL